MKEKNFKEIYPRIVKKHPRIKDFEPLHKVMICVAENGTKGKGITAREISREIDIPVQKVNTCLKHLVESDYLRVAKGQKSRIFFSAEKKDGNFEKPLFDRESIKKAEVEKKREVIKAAETSPDVLDEEAREDLKKLSFSKELDSSSRNAYNRLVERFWKIKMFENLTKISLRSTANRYSV